jgi:hypothetical protein
MRERGKGTGRIGIGDRVKDGSREGGEGNNGEDENTVRKRRERRDKKTGTRQSDTENASEQQRRQLLTKSSSKKRKRDKEKDNRKADLEAHGLATLKCCNPQWLELMHARVAPVYTMELDRGWQFT